MEELNFTFFCGIIYTEDVKHFHTLAYNVFRFSIKYYSAAWWSTDSRFRRCYLGEIPMAPHLIGAPNTHRKRKFATFDKYFAIS